MHRPPPSRGGLRDPLWLLYRTALLLLSPVWAPWLTVRLLVGRGREGRSERLGGGRLLPPPPDTGRAWFHGVSVGEVEALAPVVAGFRRARPGAEVVVTTTTPTGRARAEALYPDIHDRRFAPVDLPWTTGRAFRRIRPSILVLGESELWPSLLRQASRNVPVVVVNGRISDQTLPRARRFRPFYRWMLGRVTAVGVQTAADRDRFVALGLDPSRIRVTGNTKFDRHIATPTPAEQEALRRELGIGAAPLILAGSTFPGEDELLLDALSALSTPAPASAPPSATGPDPETSLRLLLAPRHPERAEAVEALARARGWSTWRRSQGPAPRGLHPRVVILDTVGELATFYALARVAVVGRSFRTGGGQNPLEPMAHGIPVVFGPQMENFRQIASVAEASGAALRCPDDDALVPTLTRILGDPTLHASLAAAGPRVLEAHRGASERSARLIVEALDADPEAGRVRVPAGARPPGGRQGRHALVGAWLTAVGVAAGMGVSGCAAPAPDTLGDLASGLHACPEAPACVHSGEGVPPGTPAFTLAPAWKSTSTEALFDEVSGAVASLPRTRTVDRQEGEGFYLRAEATSRIFRFVDDLEVLYRPGAGALVVRSASRVGQSDLGVNAARVAALREILVERGVVVAPSQPGAGA